MARQTITFVLDSERDRDILRWLANQENKSAAIREAVRMRLRHNGISLSDIYEAILDLQRRNWISSSAVQVSDISSKEEPPDVAAALDSLGL
jgi:hypothetical protein